MKKIKILLPIASVATLAGTITPLMTSCGSSTTVSDVIPTDALWIEDVTLMGFKPGTKIDESWTTLSIPEGVKIVNNEAFKDVFVGDKCNVKKVIFPSTTYRIGESAFVGCDTINALDLSAVSDPTNVYLLGSNLGASIFDENAAKRFGNVVLPNSSKISNNWLVPRLKASGIPEPWLYETSTNKLSLTATEITAHNAKGSIQIDLKDNLPEGGKVTVLIEVVSGTDNVVVTLGEVTIDDPTQEFKTATLPVTISSTSSDALKDGDYVKFNIQFIAHDEYGAFAWKQVVEGVSVTYQYQEVAASELVISGEEVLSAAGTPKVKYTAVTPDPVHEKLYSSVSWAIESQTLEGGATIDSSTGELAIHNTIDDNEIVIKATAKNKDNVDITGTFNINVVSPMMTITFAEAGEFGVDGENTQFDYYKIEYSKDGKEWTEFTKAAPVATFAANEKIYLRGKGKERTDISLYQTLYFSSKVKYSIGGSALSLLNYGNDPEITISKFNSRVFQELFANQTTLISVSKGFLYGINSIPEGGFNAMFSGCTSLTSAPDIYAKIANYYSCAQMFKDCSSLKELPKLYPTSLNLNCYGQMFYGCTSIESIPDGYLPVTTLPEAAYQQMFMDCTSLKTLPSNLLPANSIGQHAYQEMFCGCTKLTTAMDELPAPTIPMYAYNGMFSGCTSLTKAPIIQAKTSAEKLDKKTGQVSGYVIRCCWEMFYNCKALSFVSLPNWTLPITTDYFSGWLEGVAATGSIYAPNFDGDTIDSPTMPDGWVCIK